MDGDVGRISSAQWFYKTSFPVRELSFRTRWRMVALSVSRCQPAFFSLILNDWFYNWNNISFIPLLNLVCLWTCAILYWLELTEVIVSRIIFRNSGDDVVTNLRIFLEQRNAKRRIYMVGTETCNFKKISHWAIIKLNNIFGRVINTFSFEDRKKWNIWCQDFSEKPPPYLWPFRWLYTYETCYYYLLKIWEALCRKDLH